MASSIQALAFGDKGAIARTLTTKGVELRASIIESAVLPILSNALCGHSTFKGILSGKSHNAQCPLQSALWSLMHTKTGKSANSAPARAISSVFALAKPVTTQQAHDDTVSEAILLIAECLTPAQREKTERTDWKALAESLQAQLQACQIDLAECQALLAEAQATPAPAPAPAPAMV